MTKTPKNSVSRRAALIGLGLAAASPSVARPSGKGARPPNILYIMADDMGHADLGCYGGRTHKTPAIDRIARRGIRLTQAYANSCVCSPTRTALITGCYQGRFPIGLEEPIALNGDELALPRTIPLLPKAFKALGYDTALVGKWHLGELPISSPLDYGYDYFYGVHSGGTDYFAHAATLLGREMGHLYEGRDRINQPGYLTDLLGAKAVDRVRRAHAARKPLFLSLHFTAPHWPWQGPGDEASASATRDPRQMDGGSIADYARMIASMDANIGLVLAELARLGQLDNTIVLFTSDNGGERFSDMWPLTGTKGELLEGGIRVPLLVSWPDRLPQGAVSHQVAMSMDTMPTLLAATGGPAPEGIDGVSLLPALKDPRIADSRTVFWRHKAGDQAAVRMGTWKYLRLYGKEFLFDLAADERERADVKARYPDRLAELKQAHQQWAATMLPYPQGSYSEDMKGKFADRY